MGFPHYVLYSVEADDERSHKGKVGPKSSRIREGLERGASSRHVSVESLGLQFLALLLRHLLIRAVQLEIQALPARFSLGFLRTRDGRWARQREAARGEHQEPRKKNESESRLDVRPLVGSPVPEGKNLQESERRVFVFRADSASVGFRIGGAHAPSPLSSLPSSPVSPAPPRP